MSYAALTGLSRQTLDEVAIQDVRLVSGAALTGLSRQALQGLAVAGAINVVNFATKRGSSGSTRAPDVASAKGHQR